MHDARLIAPAHALIRPVRASRILPAIPLHAAAITALLLTCVAIFWINSAWVNGLWQTLLLAYAGIAAMVWSDRVPQPTTRALSLACVIPAWGAIQIALGHSAYHYATLLSILAWTTIPAAFLLGLIVLRDRNVRDAFLHGLWFVAAAVTALELYQQLILGRYSVTSTGYPLISSNLYAELAELLLPAVLATALRKGSNLWLGCGLTALLLATTIAAGARMGTALLVLEVVAIFFAIHKKENYRQIVWRKQGLLLAALLLAVIGLEGTSGLSNRFEEADPLQARAAVLHSAVEMIHQHPFVGYGLGAFPIVYPQFAHVETQGYVNHVHNDYLELAAEGGIVALLLWFLFLASCLPAVVKAPWAFGIVATLLHAGSDFPLYRTPVIALMSFLLAAAATKGVDTRQRLRLKSRIKSTAS